MNRTLKTILTIAVGYVTFFGAVFLSIRAEAGDLSAGTFVPVACGEAASAENESIVSGVCLGNILGEDSNGQMSAFEFRDQAGTPAVYRVTEVSNLLVRLMSGATRAQVFMVGPAGDEVAMKVIRTADGSLKNAEGRIGGTAFMVPDFAPVRSTL